MRVFLLVFFFLSLLLLCFFSAVGEWGTRCYEKMLKAGRVPGSVFVKQRVSASLIMGVTLQCTGRAP